MSDSELSDAPFSNSPTDEQLEKSLREQVNKAARANEEATVNTIRSASERDLGLSEGFYTNHVEWKARSKDIIKNQFETPVKDDTNGKKPKTPAPNKNSQNKGQKETEPKRPPKRKSPNTSKQPRKKSKPVTDDESDLSSLSSDNGEDSMTDIPSNSKPKKTIVKPKVEASKKVETAAVSKDTFEDPGSELSVLLDDEDPPPPKKRAKSKEAASTKPKVAKTTKNDTSAAADPDQEEIKRLQSWLVKCGVRKVWGKELKPYETPKAKIKHLKSMLADVGMTGRYSNEKASQIKESRELAADIEAVQEGAQRWGKNGEDDEDTDSKTRTGKRLVRGSKHYDFLSSDGEETD